MSNTIVRCTLRWEGLVAMVQQRKPLLTRKHVLARLRFSQRYAKWTIHDWKPVIFNDETKINMFNFDGRSWCWITDGEHVQLQHVQQKVKHGGRHVMIWDCMTAFRHGAWYKIQGVMDRYVYKFILENFLLSTI